MRALQTEPDDLPVSTPSAVPPQAPGTDPSREVLLALEELAREQAAELTRQNEALMQQNAELLRANRLKSEFLTMISHELRTPLNAVLGYSEILLERIAGPLQTEQVTYLEAIHQAGQNLLGMINSLLDLAKIEAGKLEFHCVPMELQETVAQAVDLVRSMSLRKSQTLTFEGVSAPCFADPQRVRQIALNLLSNAVKFTPKGGQITVTVKAEGDVAELLVRDSGIGIDPAHHDVIFESFQQLDSGLSREYPGTGVGLALVKRFTRSMGGSVLVESTVGQGATFRIRLPTRPLEASPQ